MLSYFFFIFFSSGLLIFFLREKKKLQQAGVATSSQLHEGKISEQHLEYPI